MKKRIAALLCAALLAAAALCPAARALEGTTEQVPVGLASDAESIVLYSVTHDTVVLAKNAGQARAIASTTKMMTALLVLESGLSMDTVITVPEHLQPELERIAAENGYTMDIRVGEQLTARTLMYMTLMESANDAASVLADFVGGSIEAFVARMNEKAAAMGCGNTHFSCPHGLYDADNYSTAEDLLRIALACYTNSDYMAFADNVTVGLPETDWRRPAALYTTNHIMRVENGNIYRAYAHAIKTGFTDAAGRCNVMAGAQNGEEYILIVLGSTKESLDYECTSILDWAFSSLTPQTVLEAGSVLAQAPVEGAAQSGLLLDLRAEKAVTLCLQQGQSVRYTTEVAPLTAPLEAGAVCGSATLWVDERAVCTVPLVAAQAVAAEPSPGAAPQGLAGQPEAPGGFSLDLAGAAAALQPVLLAACKVALVAAAVLVLAVMLLALRRDMRRSRARRRRANRRSRSGPRF